MPVRCDCMMNKNEDKLSIDQVNSKMMVYSYIQYNSINKLYRSDQGFPTFLWPCTPSAFWRISMYPFSVSKDKHVPLQYFNRWTCAPKISYDKIFCHD